MNTKNRSPKSLRETIDILLQSCTAVTDQPMGDHGGISNISHPVMQPLINIHRSRLCSFAMAVVFSSILEYATRGPCIGQAARRINDIHMLAASRKRPPGRMKKAGTATKSKTDSNKNKKLLRKTSTKPAGDMYSSALLFDVRNGMIIHGIYRSILVRTPRSCISRCRGSLRHASVVVLASGSIWGGMNLMAFAMIDKNRDSDNDAQGRILVEEEEDEEEERETSRC